MRKLFKILIIVGTIVAIATPSIWLGVYFYAQDRVENTDVTIESFAITNLSDGALEGTVNFTISEPTVVEATFRITEVNVTYDSVLIGEGEVITTEFSTKLASHLADFTLNITNEIAFSDFIDDFVALTSLEIVIDVNVEFLGALATLPDKAISKTIDMDGLGAMTLDLVSFDLIGTTEDELNFDIVAEIYNPSPVEVNISSIYSDVISMNTTKLGNITKTNFFIQSGINTVHFDAWLDGPKFELSNLLSSYITGYNNSFWLNYTITCDELNGLTIEEDLYEVELQGSQIELIEVDVQMIDLDITGLPTTVAYQVDTVVTFNNPVGFEIEIIAFEGVLNYDDNDEGVLNYDDNDGVSYYIPPIGPTLDYAIANNIFLTDIDLNWSSAPITLTGYGHDSDTFTFSDSNIETGVRLFDEYFTDNDLYVDIVTGKLYVEIG
ncbi:MAG: DUF3712 domain-containing protein, partial [Candidatus Heimdallarchaeota archaeon]